MVVEHALHEAQQSNVNVSSTRRRGPIPSWSSHHRGPIPSWSSHHRGPNASWSSHHRGPNPSWTLWSPPRGHNCGSPPAPIRRGCTSYLATSRNVSLRWPSWR